MWWIKFWIQRLSRVLGLSIFNTTTKKRAQPFQDEEGPQSCFPKYSYEGLIRRNWEKHPTQIGLLFSKESISQQVKQINFSSPFNIKTLCFCFYGPLWLRTKNRISTWPIKNWAAMVAAPAPADRLRGDKSQFHRGTRWVEHGILPWFRNESIRLSWWCDRSTPTFSGKYTFHSLGHFR